MKWYNDHTGLLDDHQLDLLNGGEPPLASGALPTSPHASTVLADKYFIEFLVRKENILN